MSSLVGYGFTVGLDALEGLKFTPHRPYAGCRICGTIFQSDYDREPESFVTPSHPVEAVETYGAMLQTLWRERHNKQHTEADHRQLALSGRWLTPEAAIKFAAFGIISIIDLAIDQEVGQAYYESKPIPTDDVEGS